MGALKDGELIEACKALGIEGPYSFEPTGEIWTGTDDERVYHDVETITNKAIEMKTAKEAAKQAALDKLVALGLTVEDLRVLGL